MSASVSLIIPALNEADCIGPLLAELPAGIVQELIVVDNGSTDGTGAAARTAGAAVVWEARRGYGYACAAGAAAAQGEVLAFMDGDGSFLPGELPALLEPVLSRQADLALGSRLLKSLPLEAMPAHQRFGNQLISLLLSKLYGVYLTDLGPLRALDRQLLAALEMREMTYGWPVEMIVKVARQHLRICEVPVTYRPRLAGKSKVGGTLSGTLLTTYRIFRVLIQYAS